MHYAETPQQAAARARALDSRGLREGDVRIPAGCAIAGLMDKSGARHDGCDILKAIALMHDRSNGLAEASPRMASIRNMPTSMRSTCFMKAMKHA